MVHSIKIKSSFTTPFPSIITDITKWSYRMVRHVHHHPHRVDYFRERAEGLVWYRIFGVINNQKSCTTCIYRVEKLFFSLSSNKIVRIEASPLGSFLYFFFFFNSFFFNFVSFTSFKTPENYSLAETSDRSIDSRKKKPTFRRVNRLDLSSSGKLFVPWNNAFKFCL